MIIFQILDEVTDVTDRFQRFNFYAPYVKTLEIHPDDELVCSVKGWSVLTDELQARGRPLLPNLEALRFLSSEIFVPRAPSAVVWIATFATDTLRVLSMRLCYPDASMRLSSGISMFLEVLAKRSPHVQALSFYPSKNCNQFDISTSTFLDPWYTRLGLFQSLRSLSFSSAALSLPCFLALGQLPCLASLEFFPGYFARYTLAADLDDNVNLPESSFSALRQLSLIHVSPRGMAKALSIRPLVQHITTLKAKILFYWYDNTIHRHDNWVTSQFFARLDNVPCLSNLQIEFEFSVSGSRVGLDMGEHIVPDILARLLLNMVKLSNVYLRTGPLGMDLGTVLSNVTRLELPAQYASLQELSYFAFMPNLRHLEVTLNLATTYSPGLADIQIFLSLQAPLSVLWGTGLSEISTDDTVVVHNARYVMPRFIFVTLLMIHAIAYFACSGPTSNVWRATGLITASGSSWLKLLQLVVFQAPRDFIHKSFSSYIIVITRAYIY